MMPSRSRRVAATVVASLLVLACGDDMDMASSFGGPAGGTPAGGMTSGSGGSGTDTSTGEDPTSAGPGPGTNSESNATTNDPSNVTTEPSTDPTFPGSTGNESTGGPDPTNDPSMPAGCGNGVLDQLEQCDGQNLNGFTCESLGNAGGTLQCDPVTCTFDTQLCESGDSGGTSG